MEPFLENVDDLAVQCFEEAIDQLNHEITDTPVTWSAIHMVIIHMPQ